MKSRKKDTWIAVVTGLFLIVALIIIKINSIPQVEGWNDFKKAAIKNYSFIQDVNINRITPLDFYISYRLSDEVDKEEVDELFFMTENYIFSEKVFKDLQEYHAKKYKYSFSRINIEFFLYKENNDNFKCKIFSFQDVNGEANYNDFNTWYIKYNNEPSELYNPILK